MATTKKSQQADTPKINKSAWVRQTLEENPELTTKEIQDKAVKEGVGMFAASLVYTIKGKMTPGKAKTTPVTAGALYDTLLGLCMRHGIDKVESELQSISKKYG